MYRDFVSIVAKKVTILSHSLRKTHTVVFKLFLALKTDNYLQLVERIVTDIDAIVGVVSFQGWQKTVSRESEVQKALLKYKLHNAQVLFDRAYGYIKKYYLAFLNLFSVQGKNKNQPEISRKSHRVIGSVSNP